MPEAREDCIGLRLPLLNSVNFQPYYESQVQKHQHEDTIHVHLLRDKSGWNTADMQVLYLY
jgi:hypothetical protein